MDQKDTDVPMTSWDTDIAVGEVENKNTGSTRKYTEEDVQHAVMLVQQGCTYNQAVGKTGVPKSTIFHRRSGKKGHSEAHVDRRLFDKEEEEQLVDLMLLSAQSAMLNNRRKISAKIADILTKVKWLTEDGILFKDRLPCYSWVRNFINRNNLHERLAECLSKRPPEDVDTMTEEESVLYKRLIRQMRINGRKQRLVEDVSKSKVQIKNVKKGAKGTGGRKSIVKKPYKEVSKVSECSGEDIKVTFAPSGGVVAPSAGPSQTMVKPDPDDHPIASSGVPSSKVTFVPSGHFVSGVGASSAVPSQPTVKPNPDDHPIVSSDVPSTKVTFVPSGHFLSGAVAPSAGPSQTTVKPNHGDHPIASSGVLSGIEEASGAQEEPQENIPYLPGWKPKIWVVERNPQQSTATNPTPVTRSVLVRNTPTNKEKGETGRTLSASDRYYERLIKSQELVDERNRLEIIKIKLEIKKLQSETSKLCESNFKIV